MAEPIVTVEETETGKFIIVRRVQQVFNYGYADREQAEKIATNLSTERIDPGGNWKNFEDRGDLAFGSSTKGTAVNKDPSADAWFIHVIPVNRK